MLSKHIYHSVLQPTFYMGLSKQTLNSLRERLYRIYSCILHACMLSGSVMSNSLRPHKLQRNRLPSPSLSPGAYSNSCPLSQWYHPTILSSVIPFSSCLHLSQHQGLFQWVSSSDQVAKVLELQLQHQSFQWYSCYNDVTIKMFLILPHLRQLFQKCNLTLGYFLYE